MAPTDTPVTAQAEPHLPWTRGDVLGLGVGLAVLAVVNTIRDPLAGSSTAAFLSHLLRHFVVALVVFPFGLMALALWRTLTGGLRPANADPKAGPPNKRLEPTRRKD